MAAFKLPRLKSNLAIVNGQGRPTDFFLRLFNIDMAQRLETIINDQQAIIDAIVAAQAAADAAQVAAEAAQDAADAALAQSGSGARYAEINGAPGGTTAVVTISSVSPLPRLQLSGSLTGGTLDADATWTGQAEFFEDDGTTINSLGTQVITVESSGDTIGGEWIANDSSPFAFEAVGTLAGTVQYSVGITRTGGSNYVQGASINSVLTITPRAT